MKKRTQKKKKFYRYNRKSRKFKNKSRKGQKGGGNFRTSWVGVANHLQPTGFGWLDKSFFRPCR